jgi:hypothetical protein
MVNCLIRIQIRNAVLNPCSQPVSIKMTAQKEMVLLGRALCQKILYQTARPTVCAAGNNDLTFFEKIKSQDPEMRAKFNSKTHIKYVFHFF